MLSIPEEQIYVLYEYEDLKEEITFKDILFNIIYDIKHYMGVILDLEKLKSIITLDSLDKYIKYLKDFLDPYNRADIIIYDTKKLYEKYKNKYVSNIPTQFDSECPHSTLLDDFLNSILENECISAEYYSFSS